MQGLIFVLIVGNSCQYKGPPADDLDPSSNGFDNPLEISLRKKNGTTLVELYLLSRRPIILQFIKDSDAITQNSLQGIVVMRKGTHHGKGIKTKLVWTEFSRI